MVLTTTKRNHQHQLTMRAPLLLLIFGLLLTTVTKANPQNQISQSQSVSANGNIPESVLQLIPQIFNKNGVGAAAAAPPANVDDDYFVPYSSDVHDNFSWNLLKQILHEESGNAIFSPFSVKLVLALLAEAAGNETDTQKELLTATSLSVLKAPDNLRGYYKKVLSSLKNQSPYYTLNMETKIFTDSFIEAQQRYASLVHSYYYTDIERLNFGNSSASASAINSWINTVTNGRLKQLVTEDSVKNAVIIMANAIYFKGLWRSQFDEPFDSIFFKTPQNQIRSSFIEQTNQFYFHDSQSLDAKFLRLPYKGGKFSMFLVLPKTKAGVDELVSNLNNEQYKRVQFLMERQEVKVILPKFKFELNKNLKDTLGQLGIHAIFTDSASLPGLARGAEVANRLKVTNIFQKSGIEVNEKGTEAFASTVVEIGNKFGGNSDKQEFIANHPFIFFIEEETTGNIIFAGKVIEPKAE